MRSILLCALVLGLAGPTWCASAYTTTVEATAQAVLTVAGAWVDFPAFLKLGGETAAFAPESVVVRPADPADAAPVASRVEESQGAYRVFWQVPAVAQKDVGQPVTFRIEFGVKPAPGGSPRLPASAVDTLIANGGFEEVTDQGIPVGIAAAIFKRDFRLVAEKEGRALAFNADPEGRGPAFITPWVSVRGGESLAYSFRFRARGAEAHPRYKVILFSYVNYRDAEGKPLPRRMPTPLAWAIPMAGKRCASPSPCRQRRGAPTWRSATGAKCPIPSASMTCASLRLPSRR